MFKRMLAILLAVLVLVSGAAMAEIMYISYGDYGEPIGDLQYLLGVKEKYRGDYYFGDETYAALDAFQYEMGLERTGMFDADTLEALLDVYPRSEWERSLVWVPMFGGNCYHDYEGCGNMLEPRVMSVASAEALGFYSCMRKSCFG